MKLSKFLKALVKLVDSILRIFGRQCGSSKLIIWKTPGLKDFSYYPIKGL